MKMHNSLNGFSPNDYTDKNACIYKLCIFNEIYA